MDDKMKTVISWTLFWAIVVMIILGVIVPWLVLTYCPTLFPKADLSGFENSMNTSSIIVSFASAGLGVFSIYQASSSSKEMKTLLDSINEVKIRQQQMNEILKPMIVDSHPKTADWKPDSSNAE